MGLDIKKRLRDYQHRKMGKKKYMQITLEKNQSTPGDMWC